MKKKYRKNFKRALKVFEGYEKYQVAVRFDTDWVFKTLAFSFLQEQHLNPSKKEKELMRTHQETLAIEKYFKRIFGWKCNAGESVIGLVSYNFLFGRIWADFDSTAKGIIKRIRYYLKNEEKIKKNDWNYRYFRGTKWGMKDNNCSTWNK